MPPRLAKVPANRAQVCTERVGGADEGAGGGGRVLAGPAHAHHRTRADVGHQRPEEGPLLEP